MSSVFEAGLGRGAVVCSSSSSTVSALCLQYDRERINRVFSGFVFFSVVFSRRTKIVTFVMSHCSGRQSMTSDTKPGKTSKMTAFCLFFNLLNHLYTVWTILVFPLKFRFIVRDFQYNEEEMKADKEEMNRLSTDKKKQFVCVLNI